MEVFYIWLLVAVILGIIEISTTNLVSIWFVISSLLAMVSSLFTDNILIQITIFVLVGVLLMPISRKLYSKIKMNNSKTNIDRIIGMKGIVTEDIIKDNIGEVKSYYYLSSPDYPMIKDKPKKLLILVIGFLIGLILSSFIILLSSLIQSTKKR